MPSTHRAQYRNRGRIGRVSAASALASALLFAPVLLGAPAARADSAPSGSADGPAAQHAKVFDFSRMFPGGGPMPLLDDEDASAGTFTVTDPAPGAAVGRGDVTFTGTGVGRGDWIVVSYVDSSGSTVVPMGFPVPVGLNLTWTSSAFLRFAALPAEQEKVAFTVTEVNPDGYAVTAPITVVVDRGPVPVPEFPFAITSPAAGARVETYAPVISGTAGPGDRLEVQATDFDEIPVIAGSGVADETGAYSIALDLSAVDQEDDGETVVTLNVQRTPADGSWGIDVWRSVPVVFAPDQESSVPATPPVGEPAPADPAPSDPAPSDPAPADPVDPATPNADTDLDLDPVVAAPASEGHGTEQHASDAQVTGELTSGTDSAGATQLAHTGSDSASLPTVAVLLLITGAALSVGRLRAHRA